MIASTYLRPSLLTLAIFALSVTSTQTYAVTFCALRDPVNTIYELFPDADSYRSSVKTVGRQARQAAIERLPFSLHFNELGRHTLYVAQKNGRPIGFVHARSEQGEWGIVEYAWAISTDMRMIGVKIQRARDLSLRRNSEILSAPVLGKDLPTLMNEFSTDPKPDSVLSSLRKSAMKTLVITETVWSDEVATARQLSLAKDVFPSAAATTSIPNLYDPNTENALRALDMSPSPSFDRTLVTGHSIQDAAGKRLGMLVQTPFAVEDTPRTLWWVVSMEGTILQVVNQGASETAQGFAPILGFSPQLPQDCSSLADLAALEIATLARRHARG